MDILSVRPATASEPRSGRQGGQLEATLKPRTIATPSPVLKAGEDNVASAPLDIPAQKNVATGLQKIADVVTRKPADLKFSVDEVTGRIIVRVIDPESGEVTRQIPPEGVLKIARNIADGRGSLLLDKKA